MALRWAAASFVETEKSYRRIIGYDQLWMLRAHLDDHEPVAEMRKAGDKETLRSHHLQLSAGHHLRSSAACATLRLQQDVGILVDQSPMATFTSNSW